MRITFDPDADALYIELCSIQPDDSCDIEDGATVALGSEGQIIGLEILDVSMRLGPEVLASVTVEQLS